MVEIIAINIAYALYVASGFIKTFLRLRLGMIVVSIAFITWGVIAGNWSAVSWNVAFGTVHAYQLFRLWAHHRSIVLTSAESEIHHRLFADLDLIDFYTLWSIGTARTVLPGTKIISQGQHQEDVLLIVAGEVSVEQDGVEVTRLGPDALIGERSYLTGDRANATVISATEVTVHEWSQRKMAALVELCPAAHESMVRRIGVGLAHKL